MAFVTESVPHSSVSLESDHDSDQSGESGIASTSSSSVIQANMTLLATVAPQPQDCKLICPSESTFNCINENGLPAVERLDGGSIGMECSDEDTDDQSSPSAGGREQRSENARSQPEAGGAESGNAGGDDDKENSSTDMEEEEEYEVKDILDIKSDEKGNVYFRVSWLGWSSRHNSWEPVEHLLNAQEKLQDFVSKKAAAENITPLHGALDSLRKTGAKGHSINVLHMPQHRKIGEWLVTVLPKQSVDEIKTIAAEKLKRFERKIQDVCLAAGEPTIRVVNDLDTEGLPEDFQYIIDYVAGDGVVIPCDPPLFCLCGSDNPEPGKERKGCSYENNGCCPVQMHNYLFAYAKNKKLRIAPGSPIFECNKNCKCAANPELCDNRVVQRGRQFPMTIKRCPGKGWGVFVDKPVKRDAFLLEYIGEVINNTEAEIRGRDYDLQGSTYLFDLDFDDSDNLYTVDATFYGNITHFVNHSCDPNMAMFPVWIDCLDPRLPRIAFFARREIKAGEELTFNYNDSACRNIKKKKTNGDQLLEHGEPVAGSSAIKRQKCLCQSANCCGYFFR